MNIRKVYFNSTSKCWSLIDPKTGLVDKSQKTIFVILKDVEFKVSEKIRQRIIERKKKFVCAVACGEVVCAYHDVPCFPSDMLRKGRPVTFNPYRGGTFVSEGQPIYDCERLVMIVHDKKPFLYAY